MHIQDLDHLRSNSMIRFKIEEVNGTPVEIVSYMIGDKTLWEDPAALETRGNTYSTKTGECICACFPKFFNLGERADTQPDIVKDQFVEVFEKRDGCLEENTLIETEDGLKTIKEICETEYRGCIIGYDVKTKKFVSAPVEGTSIKEDDQANWFEIELENGTVCKMTGNHQVWSNSKMSYIRADELTVGDDVVFKQF